MLLTLIPVLLNELFNRYENADPAALTRMRVSERDKYLRS